MNHSNWETPPEQNARPIEVQITVELRYDWEVVHRYSSVFRIFRITAYCLKFVCKYLKSVLIYRQSSKHLMLIKLRVHSLATGNSQETDNLITRVDSSLNQALKFNLLELSFMQLTKEE